MSRKVKTPRILASKRLRSRRRLAMRMAKVPMTKA
jgi:hypothetical protein